MDQATILIVDDDVDVARGLARRLRFKGYDVITAQSGSEALDFLAKADVDVLVTDLHMPGLVDGKALCEQARRLGKAHLKIILMSGYGDLAQAQLPEIKLEKPFIVQDLLDLIA